MSLTQVEKLKWLIARNRQQAYAHTLDIELEALLARKQKRLLADLGGFHNKTRAQIKETIEAQAEEEALALINNKFLENDDERENYKTRKTSYLASLQKSHIAALKKTLSKKYDYIGKIELKQLIDTQNKAYQNDLKDALLKDLSTINDAEKLQKEYVKSIKAAEIARINRKISKFKDKDELIEEYNKAQNELIAYQKRFDEAVLKQAIREAQLEVEDKKKRQRLVFGRWPIDFFSALHQAKGFALSCGCTMAGALLLLLTDFNAPKEVLVAAMPLSFFIIWSVTRANWWICNQVVPAKFIYLFCDKDNALITWKQLLTKAADDFIHLRWLSVSGFKKGYIFLNSIVTGLVWSAFTYVTSDKLINCLGEEFAEIFGVGLLIDLSLFASVIASIMAIYTFPTFFCVCLTGLKKNADGFSAPYKRFWEALKEKAKIKAFSIDSVRFILCFMTALTLLGLFTTALASTPAIKSVYQFLGSGAYAAKVGAYITTAFFGFIGAGAFYEHMSRDATQNILDKAGEPGGDFEKVNTLKDNDPAGLYSLPNYAPVIEAHQQRYWSKRSLWERVEENAYHYVGKHLHFFTTQPSCHDHGVIVANGIENGLPSAVGGTSMPGAGHGIIDGVLSGFYGLAASVSSLSVNSGGNQAVNTFDKAAELDEQYCDHVAQTQAEALEVGLAHYIDTHPVNRTSFSLWGNCTPQKKYAVAHQLKEIAAADKSADLAYSWSASKNAYEITGSKSPLYFTAENLHTARDGELGHHARLLAHRHPKLKPLFLTH